jgi:hypothetical protein
LLLVLLPCLPLLINGCQAEQSAAPTAAPATVVVIEPTDLPPTVAPPTMAPPTAFPPTEVPPDPNAALAAGLQDLVDRWAADERFPSAMLLVDLPSRDFY